MALIMFSGMFGFGEMVSYISFMGDGGRGCWCGCLITTGNAALKNFPFFPIRSLNYPCCLFYYPLQYEISLVCFLCFFMPFYFWQNHKTFQHNGILRGLPIFALTCLLQNSCFQTSCTTHWFGEKLLLTLLFCLFFESNGSPVTFSYTCKDLSNIYSVILLIMWLCCGAETPGGEVFVRSFVSHYPEGFSAPYFFCSKSPGYTSVIPLLPSPPSQLKNTVGID